jgi:hypothetical protein
LNNLERAGVNESTTIMISTVVAALFGGGALGTLATVLTRYFSDKNKQQDKQGLAVTGQSVEHYDQLVTRLETRISKLEGDHQRCMEEHITASRQLGILEGRITELREYVGGNAAAIVRNTAAIQAGG